jgi:hypothetical protein
MDHFSPTRVWNDWKSTFWKLIIFRANCHNLLHNSQVAPRQTFWVLQLQACLACSMNSRWDIAFWCHFTMFTKKTPRGFTASLVISAGVSATNSTSHINGLETSLRTWRGRELPMFKIIVSTLFPSYINIPTYSFVVDHIEVIEWYIWHIKLCAESLYHGNVTFTSACLV